MDVGGENNAIGPKNDGVTGGVKWGHYLAVLIEPQRPLAVKTGKKRLEIVGDFDPAKVAESGEKVTFKDVTI